MSSRSDAQADRSHRTQRDLELETIASSMTGGATSQWNVAPSDDTFRSWSMKDIFGNSSSTLDCPWRSECRDCPRPWTPRQRTPPIEGGKRHFRDLSGRRHHHEEKNLLCQRSSEEQLSDNVLTCPPSPLSRPVFFSEEYAYAMHFPHNDAFVIAVHISCCKVSKILVDGGSSINILYGHDLYRMKDTPELACKMIIPQTQSLLYAFDGSKARSPGTIKFLVRADPCNVVTESCVLDVESPYNAILGRPWIHMLRVVPSTHHQLLSTPHHLEWAI